MTKTQRRTKRPAGDLLARVVSTWMGDDSRREAVEGDPSGHEKTSMGAEDNRPIEPKGTRTGQTGLLKWIFFVLVVAYTVFSYYHAPILSAVGGFLVVRDPVERADLIVCTPGYPVEQCLTAADLYNKDLSHRIFLPREPPLPGYDALTLRGIDYPDRTDLDVRLLKDLGVPRSAIVEREGFAGSVEETAGVVEQMVRAGDYASLMILTPPWRARWVRAVFEDRLEGRGVKLLMVPSQYSDFKKATWWKQDKYRGMVFLEYGKLLFYTLKHLW